MKKIIHGFNIRYMLVVIFMLIMSEAICKEANAQTVTASIKGTKAPHINVYQTYRVRVKRQEGMVMFRAPLSGEYTFYISNAKWVNKKNRAITSFLIDKESAQKMKENDGYIYNMKWKRINKQTKSWVWEGSKDELNIGDKRFCKRHKKWKYVTENHASINLKGGETYLFTTIGGKNYSYDLMVVKTG